MSQKTGSDVMAAWDALTFGVSVAIPAERARLRDVQVEVFRFLILFAFGACYMLLVSNGAGREYDGEKCLGWQIETLNPQYPHDH